MCARDRSENISCGQLESIDLLRQFIKIFPYPSCIRDSYGNFILSNDLFVRNFLNNHKTPTEWFSSLSAKLSLDISRFEINSFSNQMKINTYECIPTNGIHWDLNCYPIVIDNNQFCLWVFFYHKSDMLNNLSGISSNYNYFLIKNFKKNSAELHWKIFILHVFGISHEMISRILSLHRGTSRNIVSYIHKCFHVGTKDELTVIMYESGLAVELLSEVEVVIDLYKNRYA